MTVLTHAGGRDVTYLTVVGWSYARSDGVAEAIAWVSINTCRNVRLSATVFTC
jgi:hypothetical protein